MSGAVELVESGAYNSTAACFFWTSFIRRVSYIGAVAGERGQTYFVFTMAFTLISFALWSFGCAKLGVGFCSGSLVPFSEVKRHELGTLRCGLLSVLNYKLGWFLRRKLATDRKGQKLIEPGGTK
jgi:hypothetical protein